MHALETPYDNNFSSSAVVSQKPKQVPKRTFRVAAHCISLGGRKKLIIILLLVLDIFVLLYIKSLVDLLWFKFSFGAKF